MWLLDRSHRADVVTGIHGLRCWLDPSGVLRLAVDWRGAEQIRAAGVLLRFSSGATVVELGADGPPAAGEPSPAVSVGTGPAEFRHFKTLRIEGCSPDGQSGQIEFSAAGVVALLRVPLEGCFRFFQFCEQGFAAGEATLGANTCQIQLHGPTNRGPSPRPADTAQDDLSPPSREPAS